MMSAHWSRMVDCSGIEVVCLVEIGKHAGMGWTPSQPFLSQLARCGVVYRNKGAQKTELFRCLGGSLAYDGHLQPPSDHFCDLPERNTLFSHTVVRRSCGSLLECQPEEVGRVELVYRRPAVQAISNVRRLTFLACDLDELRHKPIPVTF